MELQGNIKSTATFDAGDVQLDMLNSKAFSALELKHIMKDANKLMGEGYYAPDNARLEDLENKDGKIYIGYDYTINTYIICSENNKNLSIDYEKEASLGLRDSIGRER